MRLGLKSKTKGAEGESLPTRKGPRVAVVGRQVGTDKSNPGAHPTCTGQITMNLQASRRHKGGQERRLAAAPETEAETPQGLARDYDSQKV